MDQMAKGLLIGKRMSKIDVLIWFLFLHKYLIKLNRRKYKTEIHISKS